MRIIIKYLLPIGALAVAVIAISSALTFYFYMHAPLPLSKQGFDYHLHPGHTLIHLLRVMEKEGIIKHPQWVNLYARSSQIAQRLHSGEYHFPVGTTPAQLLDILLRGEVMQYKVSFVEGKTIRDILHILRQQKKLHITLPRDISPEGLLQELDFLDNHAHPEGLFFPDTYYYVLGMSDRDILKQSYRRMQRILSAAWEKRDTDLPYRSAYEALIMASLVEKETGLASERADIAGVFVRRLERRMRLACDPTVIYGLGQKYKGNLHSRHLKDRTNPYNTYLIRGLPPTPIAAPGEKAILAAVHPADGNALYFVARGDGSHVFSETIAEHQAAVKRYQVTHRRQNYRSAPPTE